MADEIISRTHWTPTREQFDAYEKREVTMAMDNLKRFGDTTLHSSMTVSKARALIVGTLGSGYVGK